jgi:dolichol-phosphate mannosyltransferase
MKDDILSVVIPAYNEERNLPTVLSELREQFLREAIPYEIVVVNDNSKDGTATVLAEFMRVDPCIRVVTRRPPGGFGRAIRSGLDAVQGDVVVICMADSSDAPEDVVRYYRTVQEGYECVFGSRFVRGGMVTNYPRFKLAINRIVNRAIQMLFRCPYNDLTNAFKAYRAYVIRECGPYQACHFNLTIEMSLSALNRGYKVTQIPIQWRGRTWGASNLSLWKMGRRYLATLMKLYSERLLIRDDVLADWQVQRGDRSHPTEHIFPKLPPPERSPGSLDRAA